MPKNTSTHGKLSLRPRARIVNTIGKELIRNEVVALVELIKNAYDADATMVILTFEEPLLPGHGAVVIEDDGYGMDMGTVRSAWMEPATVSKLRKRVSPSGRHVTGEKGIGRFAAARIGRTLIMSSVAKGGKERVQVRFDWGAFDNEELYLDEVQCDWSTEAAAKRRNGTALRLEGLNDEWNEASLTKLRAELSRLVAPGPAKKDFAITLELPDRFKHLAGDVGSPAILSEPRYRMHGAVSATGKLTAKYSGPDGEKPFDEDLVVEGGPQFVCGPFSFSVDIWDREADDLEPLATKLKSTVTDLRRDLNASCGIGVYRDGFRILMANSDWLGLDFRRVQNPTLRLSNNQVVAFVSITSKSNPGLKDQSNREGIVEGPSFHSFQNAIHSILSKIEARRFDWRRESREDTRPLPGVFNQLDIGPISELVRKKYGSDRELLAVVERTETAFHHGVKEVQKVVSRYRRLATLGQLVDVILHEGRTPVAAIANDAQLLEMDAQETKTGEIKKLIPKRMAAIRKQTQLLSALFDRIAPFSGRKRGQPQNVVIESVLQDAVALLAKKIKDGRIAGVDLPKSRTTISAHAVDLQMVFFNLLDNAVYWVQQLPEARRKIKVQLDASSGFPVLTFSDDGPGIPDEHSRSIFDPYFSLKPDGVGLGLTIAGETATELGGGLELLEDGSLRGASFRVRLGMPTQHSNE
ncbi:MAG: GHKL domain-containing protein [Elusimicrobia bacterium]|nr:GHKL domain-containing protein [Elusimicrobiota bacterium]